MADVSGWQREWEHSDIGQYPAQFWDNPTLAAEAADVGAFAPDQKVTKDLALHQAIRAIVLDRETSAFDKRRKIPLSTIEKLIEDGFVPPREVRQRLLIEDCAWRIPSSTPMERR